MVQTEDKVFSLNQSEKNAGRFVDLDATGVLEYVERRDRRKAMTAGAMGFSLSSRLFDFWCAYICIGCDAYVIKSLVIAVVPSLSSL